jgi:hypothetical protein
MMAALRSAFAILEQVQLLESQVAQGIGRATTLDCMGGE